MADKVDLLQQTAKERFATYTFKLISQITLASDGMEQHLFWHLLQQVHSQQKTYWLNTLHHFLLMQPLDMQFGNNIMDMQNTKDSM